MSDKYNEYITIKRVSDNGITVDCHATKAHIMRSIIALFKELNNIDKYMALGLVSGLVQILEEKEA